MNKRYAINFPLGVMNGHNVRVILTLASKVPLEWFVDTLYFNELCVVTTIGLHLLLVFYPWQRWKIRINILKPVLVWVYYTIVSNRNAFSSTIWLYSNSFILHHLGSRTCFCIWKKFYETFLSLAGYKDKNANDQAKNNPTMKHFCEGLWCENVSLPKVLEFVNTISQTSVGSTKDVNTYVSTNMKLSSTGLRIFS